MSSTKEIAKFNSLVKNIEGFIAPAKLVKVDSKESKDQAMTLGMQTKGYLKEIEAVRVALTKPMNEIFKEINDYAKQLSAPLFDLESSLKRKLIGYDQFVRDESAKAEREIADRRRELEAKTQAQLAAARDIAPDEETAAEEQAQIIREARVEDAELKQERQEVRDEKVKGIKKVRKYEILHEFELPREYLMPNEKAIAGAVRGGVRSIAGVRIWEEEKMSMRSIAPPSRAKAVGRG